MFKHDKSLIVRLALKNGFEDIRNASKYGFRTMLGYLPWVGVLVACDASTQLVLRYGPNSNIHERAVLAMIDLNELRITRNEYLEILKSLVNEASADAKARKERQERKDRRVSVPLHYN